MFSAEEAKMRMGDFFPEHRPARGLLYSKLGFEIGRWRIREEGNVWKKMPTEEHSLSGLFVHHQFLNVNKIKWQIDNHEDLLIGMRPMLMVIDGNKKFIRDGCHRASALVLLVYSEFVFITYRVSGPCRT